MKKLFQSLLLVTFVLTMASCTKDSTDDQGGGGNTQPGETTFTVADSLNEAITWEGGIASVNYTLTNPLSDKVVTFGEPSATWIHDITVGNNKIIFYYDEYRVEGGSREATFTASYADKGPYTITVKQDGPDAMFDVTFSEVTPQSVKATIAPLVEGMSYMYGNVRQDEIDIYGSVEAYINYIIDGHVNSFYGDRLDSYLYNDVQERTFTYYSTPMSTPYVYVVGIQRAEDDARTPEIITGIMLKEIELAPKPILTIATNTADQFSAEAGSYTLGYVLENPFEGCELKATLSAQANWVHDLEIGENTVTFNYDANPYPVERTGKLTLTYEYAEQAGVLEFSQAANSNVTKVTFQITVKETHYDHIIVDCVPSDPNAKYVLSAVSDSDFQGYSYGYGDSTKIPSNDFNSYYGAPTAVTGTQTNYRIDASIGYYGYYDWWVYAYAVDDAVSTATSDVHMVKTTLTDDSPSLSWDDSRVTESGSYYPTYRITFHGEEAIHTIKYKVDNARPGSVVKLYGSIYGDMVKNNEVIIDQENCTITFTLLKNTTGSQRSQYISIAYYSDPDSYSSDDSISIYVDQVPSSDLGSGFI